MNSSWFLSRVIVTDLLDNRQTTFLCNAWFGIGIDDGRIDRTFIAAGDKELMQFQTIFLANTSRGFCDDHLWFSITMRPPRSNFTRCQRVSCCFCILLCTMLTNAMFYQTKYVVGSEITIGSFKFSLRQIIIGIQSALIVVPVNLIIVTLFRKSGPSLNSELVMLSKSPDTTECSDDYSNQITVDIQQHEDNRVPTGSNIPLPVFRDYNTKSEFECLSNVPEGKKSKARKKRKFGKCFKLRKSRKLRKARKAGKANKADKESKSYKEGNEGKASREGKPDKAGRLRKGGKSGKKGKSGKEGNEGNEGKPDKAGKMCKGDNAGNASKEGKASREGKASKEGKVHKVGKVGKAGKTGKADKAGKVKSEANRKANVKGNSILKGDEKNNTAKPENIIIEITDEDHTSRNISNYHY